MASSNKKLIQKLRVPLGFIFAAAFLVFARPSKELIVIGGIFGIFGLGLRAWSAGHIQKGTVLADSGPYRFTRNPLYLGSFIMGLGLMIASGVWWLIVLFAILFLCIYLPVMSVEAEELNATFGEEFTKFAEEVPLFFPGFRVGQKSSKKFESSLYLRYREYQASMGYIAIIGVLIIKASVF